MSKAPRILIYGLVALFIVVVLGLAIISNNGMTKLLYGVLLALLLMMAVSVFSRLGKVGIALVLVATAVGLLLLAAIVLLGFQPRMQTAFATPTQAAAAHCDPGAKTYSRKLTKYEGVFTRADESLESLTLRETVSYDLSTYVCNDRVFELQSVESRTDVPLAARRVSSTPVNLMVREVNVTPLEGSEYQELSWPMTATVRVVDWPQGSFHAPYGVQPEDLKNDIPYQGKQTTWWDRAPRMVKFDYVAKPFYSFEVGPFSSIVGLSLRDDWLLVIFVTVATFLFKEVVLSKLIEWLKTKLGKPSKANGSKPVRAGAARRR